MENIKTDIPTGNKKRLIVMIVAAVIGICLIGTAIFIVRNNIKKKDMMERYAGMKVTWYGDSLTQMYFHCESVDSYFGFAGHNSGVNNTLITNINDSSLCMPIRMNYGEEEDIAFDSSIIFVMAGVNDWIFNIPIGDVNKTFEDTQNGILESKTFAGACNQMFYYLKEFYPNAQIIVLGTPYADGTKAKLFEGTDGAHNEIGLTSVEYGDVLCEVADLWGIDNINIGRELSWDGSNIYEYTVDGIHFNEAVGREEVANIIIKYIKKLNGVR